MRNQKKIEEVITRSVENTVRSVVDDFVNANVKSEISAGMRPRIVRSSDGKCCTWCSSMAGEYYANEAPKDIYRRHDNCNCTVTYISDKGYQDAHTKKWIDQRELEATRERILADRKHRHSQEKKLQTGGKEREVQSYVATGGKNYKPYDIDNPKDVKAASTYRKISRTNDIDLIAKNTGFTHNEIRQIKRHIFFDKHKKYDGEYGMLDPDYDMAVAWKRLQQGRPKERDILLLKHELFESQMEKRYNLTVAEAHAMATKKYDWQSRLESEVGTRGEPDGLL